MSVYTLGAVVAAALLVAIMFYMIDLALQKERDPLIYSDENEQEKHYWGDWRNIGNSHIWYCEERSLYTFSDEAAQFNGLYKDVNQAKQALESYVVFLGGQIEVERVYVD